MTIVEAAFALPIVLTFIFGLVDLGMWTLNANQATNAARDGARLGIIDYRDGPDGLHADDEGSVQWSAIVEAAESRLEDAKVEDIAVTCLADDGSALASCAIAEVDIDSIRVDIEWSWDLITPVAVILGYDSGSATGSATMKIVGRPLPGATPTPSSSTSTSTTTSSSVPDDPSTTTTTAPPTCAVQTMTAPASVYRKSLNGNGTDQLAEAVQIDFETNGSAACTGLRIELRSPSYNSSNGNGAVLVGCGCDLDPPAPPDYRWIYDGSDNIWKPGTAEARILQGTTLLTSQNFTVY